MICLFDSSLRNFLVDFSIYCYESVTRSDHVICFVFFRFTELQALAIHHVQVSFLALFFFPVTPQQINKICFVQY